MRLFRTLLISLLAVATGLTAVATGAFASSRHVAAPKAAKSITIGYEDFPEEQVMADMYGDLLSKVGYSVKYQSSGARSSAIAALEAGKIDLLPEYAGSLLVFLNSKDTVQAGKLTTAESALNSILGKKSVAALPGAAALDQNVFAVTKATATADHLTTLSSLKADAGKFVFAAPPECSTNYFCAPGLKKVYGIKFKSLKSYDEGGPLTVQALKTGQAQVAELFSTGGADTPAHQGFVQLTDNLNLEPADHLIPVVRTSFDTAAVRSALAKINTDLTTNALEQMELAMGTGTHPSAATVAAGFLAAEHIS